jgi:hypothetical protein
MLRPRFTIKISRGRVLGIPPFDFAQGRNNVFQRQRCFVERGPTFENRES